MRVRWLVVGMFAIAPAVVACFVGEGGGGNFGPGISTPPSPPPTDTGVVVVITDNQFTPASISVPAGRIVRWLNQGSQVHTVTANDASFNSGGIAAGGNFQRTFPAAGTFPYLCTIHAGMSGSVTVLP